MKQVDIEDVADENRSEQKLHIRLVGRLSLVYPVNDGSQREHSRAKHFCPCGSVRKPAHSLPVKKQKDKQDAHDEVDVVGRRRAGIEFQILTVIGQLTDKTKSHGNNKRAIEVLLHLRDRLPLLPITDELIDDHSISQKPT